MPLCLVRRCLRSVPRLNADDATSMVVSAPIIPQFYPSRGWLWRKWSGTILKRVLPKEVAFNMVFAAIVAFIFARYQAAAAAAVAAPRSGGFMRAAAPAVAAVTPDLDFILSALASIDKVWMLSSGLVSFTLSFFLTQAAHTRPPSQIEPITRPPSQGRPPATSCAHAPPPHALSPSPRADASPPRELPLPRVHAVAVVCILAFGPHPHTARSRPLERHRDALRISCRARREWRLHRGCARDARVACALRARVQHVPVWIIHQPLRNPDHAAWSRCGAVAVLAIPEA